MKYLRKFLTFENIIGLNLFDSNFCNWIFASIFYAVALYIKYYILDKI